MDIETDLVEIMRRYLEKHRNEALNNHEDVSMPSQPLEES